MSLPHARLSWQVVHLAEMACPFCLLPKTDVVRIGGDTLSGNAPERILQVEALLRSRRR